MNLLIHDLTPEMWEKVRDRYEGWKVVSDSGTIRPCTGCFSCWHKTPGRCVVPDGYENMGLLIHQAEEVVVMSRYTYGGFSGFVKNVFDRCLGYVLPQFEIISGESHHQKRYDEDKPFTFIFYSRGRLTEKEKESAYRYVKAVCTNIRGHVKEVIFKEAGRRPAPVTRLKDEAPGKVLLLNGSMRSVSGNSAQLMKQLASRLKKETETAALREYAGCPDMLLARLDEAEVLVLCVPLYVDGLPSQVIRFMEMAEERYGGASKKVYVLANMGLYETRQLINLFSTVRQWCRRMGFEYAGGLGVSAGELIGTIMQSLPFAGWPTGTVARGMDRLAAAIDSGGDIRTLCAGPWLFPRSLYIWIANTNWRRLAKKNGIRPKDLYRRL